MKTREEKEAERKAIEETSLCELTATRMMSLIYSASDKSDLQFRYPTREPSEKAYFRICEVEKTDERSGGRRRLRQTTKMGEMKWLCKEFTVYSHTGEHGKGRTGKGPMRSVVERREDSWFEPYLMTSAVFVSGFMEDKACTEMMHSVCYLMQQFYSSSN